MINLFVNTSYLLANTLMILSIKLLSSPKTARIGNLFGICGMFWAIIAALISLELISHIIPILVILSGALAGICIAYKVKITSLPQMIAAFNGMGGLAAACISLSEISSGSEEWLNNTLSLVIGSITFCGSIVAFAKLNWSRLSAPLHFYAQYIVNSLLFLLGLAFGLCFMIHGNISSFYALGATAGVLGFMLVLPIGGADIPIAISVLNAMSGWACVFVGLSLQSPVLIIIGTIVGTGGTFLARVMTKAVNRSLFNILTGSFALAGHGSETEKTAQQGSPQDAAFLMENAANIIIVPGYGLASAHAQYALKNMADILRQTYHVNVKFAIHPVAGRMPGHMNVLLAEADVDYADVYELGDINHEFAAADVAYVIGANDITNPNAKTDASSPIYGMPILEVAKAKTIFFVKRSLASGYSGIDNPLFYQPNTYMLYGDAKAVTEEIIKALEA